MSDHLRDQYWRMKKQLGEEIEACSICMEASDCRRCCCLLTCGHVLCYPCYVRYNVACPVCRQ